MLYQIYLLGGDYIAVTTAVMESMIIVGLAIGPFARGTSDNELCMKKFIKYVTRLTPIIEERRSLKSEVQYALTGQRSTLFSVWGIYSKTEVARRSMQGRFIKAPTQGVEEEESVPRTPGASENKKRKHGQVFDFRCLLDDSEEQIAEEESNDIVEI